MEPVQKKCLVCNSEYTGLMNAHLQSQQHKDSLSDDQDFYKEIDFEIKNLKIRQEKVS